MIVLLNPSKSQQERLAADSSEIPLWFGAPLLSSVPGAVFERSFFRLLWYGFRWWRPVNILVFTVGKLEAFLAMANLPGIRLFALYQWRPVEQMPLFKRSIYCRLLSKSVLLLNYSQSDSKRLKLIYSKTQNRWIGHFVDTKFFDPACCIVQPTPDPFLLCPGDHLRLEAVVQRIAECLQIKVIRFTTSPDVIDFHLRNPSRYIKCIGNISFLEVRQLYASAACIVNAVDDRHWPVGITTFCEALSMNCRIVTSGGHSCSGYHFDDCHRPYTVVEEIFDVEAWVAAISSALKDSPPSVGNRSPRDLALQLCAFDVMAESWNRVSKL